MDLQESVIMDRPMNTNSETRRAAAAAAVEKMQMFLSEEPDYISSTNVQKLI